MVILRGPLIFEHGLDFGLFISTRLIRVKEANVDMDVNL